MRVRTKHPSIYKEMIVVMRGGFGDLDSKMSTMIGKQDLMLEKQEQTTGEIRDERSDRKVMQKWSAQDSGGGASQARNSGRGFDEIKSALMHRGIVC